MTAQTNKARVTAHAGERSKSQADRQDHTKALTRIMILDGRYFPKELYSDKERKSVLLPSLPVCMPCLQCH